MYRLLWLFICFNTYVYRNEILNGILTSFILTPKVFSWINLKNSGINIIFHVYKQSLSCLARTKSFSAFSLKIDNLAHDYISIRTTCFPSYNIKLCSRLFPSRRSPRYAFDLLAPIAFGIFTFSRNHSLFSISAHLTCYIISHSTESHVTLTQLHPGSLHVSSFFAHIIILKLSYT